MAYKTGWIKKIIDGVSTKVFAFAHVKTVFYDYANSKTLKTKLDEMDTSISGKAASSHKHTKSDITDFPSSMPASDVYSWAKAATKPSYTASEVGAVPSANPVFTGSISMGRYSDDPVGKNSVAFGVQYLKASGQGSAVLGGEFNTATGKHSATVGGYGNKATGNYSLATGNYATALDYQLTCGWYSNTQTATAGRGVGQSSGSIFVIGNGNGGTTAGNSNAFRVNGYGTPYSKSGLNTTGCDYAEYFEWQDGNENDEDRRGYFVTLDGKYIKIADAGDWVLGIVSGFPSIIGNGDEEWRGRYVFDDFGTPVIETFEYEVDESETITNEDGEKETVTKKVKKTGTKWKEKPEYDSTQLYIERSERKEWSAIGMLGVLSVRDDGTCKVNGFCKLADGGIATASDKGYRVVKRVTDNIVKVVFK